MCIWGVPDGNGDQKEGKFDLNTQNVCSDQCRQLERLGHRENSSRAVDICGGSLREKRNNVEEERLSWDSISLGTCTFSPLKCKMG